MWDYFCPWAAATPAFGLIWPLFSCYRTKKRSKAPTKAVKKKEVNQLFVKECSLKAADDVRILTSTANQILSSSISIRTFLSFCLYHDGAEARWREAVK